MCVLSKKELCQDFKEQQVQQALIIPEANR